MHLSSLALTNFRACRDTVVRFAPDLTVLVGENASGKSAVVDAVRLVTFPVSGRQTAWFSANRDLEFVGRAGRKRSTDRPVQRPLGRREGGVHGRDRRRSRGSDLHRQLRDVAGYSAAQCRELVGRRVRRRRSEPALRRRIAHVYLPPLRDAVRDLDGGDQAQLHEVMDLLLAGDQEKRDHFLTTAADAVRTVAQHPAATHTRDTIQDYFSRTTPPNRGHRIGLNEQDMALPRIARLLRIQLAEADVPVADIAAAGLGYANLLYIAMIVLQLAKAEDSDLTLLLVEEPEAHLHPQLQLVLLDFLQQQARSSGQDSDAKRPAGKVQVVVTTHSPILASTVSIRQVVIVARDEDTTNWCTKTTALRELDLNPADVRKIDRYLNATRAALLFARDVVLVEGIAELLLLPALADRHLATCSEDPAPPGVSPDTDQEEREAMLRGWRRQFASATVVSVEGVDFEPYLHLLLDGPHPRVDRLVVITDRDTNAAGDLRKTTYEKEFPDATATGRLVIEVGGTTLEAEMFRDPANEKLLQRAFLALHPKSAHHWDAVATAAEGQEPTARAETFSQAIHNDKPSKGLYLDLSKGDFAHLVAEAIHADTAAQLAIPAYLSRAIEAVAHTEHDRG